MAVERTLSRGNVSAHGKLAEQTEIDIRLSQYRSQFVAQVEPKYMEWARAGVLYGYNNGSAVGLPNVAGIPTTTATWAIYNNSTSKKVVILKVAVMATTITAPVTAGLIVGLNTTAQGSETKYASSLALPLNTGQAAAEAYLTDAVTLTGTPLWQTVATYSGNSGLLGGSMVAWLDGMYVVPPDFAFAIDVIGSAGSTPLYDIDVIAAELPLDLG